MDSKGLPPGPRLSGIRLTLRWLFRPIQLLDSCQARFGDAFTLRFAGFPPLVILSNPSAIRDVFTGNPEHLQVGPISVLRPILGDRSLFLLDGATHLRERRLMMPPFHGERMQTYGGIMQQLADDSIDRWPVGRVFSLHQQMQDITLDVILRTVFGLDAGAQQSELGQAVLKMLAFGEHPILMAFIKRKGEVRGGARQHLLRRLSPWFYFQRAIDRVGALLLAEIRARRTRNETRDDVLSLLLAARDEDGQPMSDEALRDEMKTLLVAGHETTATSLTWTLWELIRNPHVLAKLRVEIDEGRHEYVDAVVKESMRLHPLSPLVARYLTEPMRIGGRDYPAGIAVVPSIYLTQRRPDVWPDPDRFEPERFLAKRESPFEFLPFGGGTRRCLGAAFAQYEMRIILQQIVRRTDLAIAPGYTPRVIRRGTTFAMSKGFPVILSQAPARRAPASTFAESRETSAV